MIVARPLRIAVVTDAWLPQVNGVVRTLGAVADELRAMGHEILVIGPDRFRTVPCPTYPEIRLALAPGRRLARLIERFRPDSLHIATEGPLGLAARAWARRSRASFTTSLHTRFPEYLAARFGLPAAPLWRLLRWFHAPAAATMVPTEGLRRELAGHGFGRLVVWSRGVNTAMFRPKPRRDWGLPRPVLLTVGRVAIEKNLQAFLDLDLPGSKVVVGDGPLLPHLRGAYPDATFTGALRGAELAEAYAGADAFVFPSRTDTFGLVLLESMACGTPVAAFPVPGPLDVVPQGAGVLHPDLGIAVCQALTLDRAGCRAHAERCGWRACAETFLDHLVPLPDIRRAGMPGLARRLAGAGSISWSAGCCRGSGRR